MFTSIQRFISQTLANMLVASSPDCESFKLHHLETGFWPFEINCYLDESVLTHCDSNKH